MNEPRNTTPDTTGLGEGLDPVKFEVIRNALLAITEEMSATLRRAAYSTNIKTRGDFSCAFFDVECRAVAQAFAQPSHLGSLAHIVPQAIEKFGRENLRDGDSLLTNDPFTGGVHLNDISLITPLFYEGELFGFMANIAHHVDVGGGAPGSIGVSNEIYQEGLVIPPVLFVRDGVIEDNIFNLIRANFRGVHEISGDFRAQTAANRLGVQRLRELLQKYGEVELRTYTSALLDYTERRVSQEFSEFPDGRYEAESWMDGDGVTGEPIRFHMVVEIDQGKLTVDLTNCDPQRKSPTNATFSQTYSAIVYVLKCLIDQDVPVNDGLYRLVDIRTRPGTLVHARHPAAVAAGWEVAVNLCDLMFKALAPAVPDRVVACGKGIICNLAFGGSRPETGEYFTYYETIAGGYGATHATDGMDAVQAHFQNTENAPVEETEYHYPVRILRYELIEDSVFSQEFSEFPDGRYEAESWMDGDGVTGEPIRFHMVVEIDQGKLTVDLTNCDPQRKSPTNATFSQTYSAIVYVLKCLIDQDVPVNDGLYRLVDIRTRPGTLVHARHPAAVAAGWEVAVNLCDLMFKALAPAVPDRVVACGKGIICNLAFGGSRPETGEYFTYYETIAGGYGATHATDGMDAVQAHFQNTENAPVEETEYHYPVRILRYELIEDSEGAGKHRGGMGVRRDYLFPGHQPSFSILSDRAQYPPWGLFAGCDARLAKYILNPDGEAKELPSKITFTMGEGEVLSVQTPGGGGYGDPYQRTAETVAKDVIAGRISPERAREAYGVEVLPGSGQVDEAATRALRNGGD